MTECYECSRLAELVAENSQLRVRVDKQAEVLDLQQELLDECDVEATTKSSEKDGNDGETNGIAADSPLVDELPERDALTLMRRGFGEMLDALGIDRNEKSHCTKAIHTLADMVERDYVSREAYEDLRDEFVWISTFLHRVGKQCGTKDVPSLKAYVEQLEAKVDELTCNDALAPENDVTPESVGANDSREKLEADMANILHSAYMYAWMHGHENRRGGSFRHIHREFFNLLDRQAAITEREREQHWLEIVGASANCNLELTNRIADLQAKVDELTAERSEIAELVGWHGEVDENGGEPLLVPMVAAMCEGSEVAADLQERVDELERETLSTCNSCAERIDLQAKADRLARENVALARDLGECMAERDGLRRENAKLSDDEFYLRSTLVDINGEVVG